MPAPDPNTRAHLEWLGFIQPNGLVVSAPALAKAGAILNRQDTEGQSRLLGCIRERTVDPARGPEPCIADFREFAATVLDWGFSPHGYAGTEEAPVPVELEVALPDYGETLRPDFAVRERNPRDGAQPWQFLVQVLDTGQDFDAPIARSTGSRLEASAQGRVERLLRATGVPAGLLFNGVALRLISAPRGESSGWMDFRVADMSLTAGRPLCSALRLLLSEQRLLALPRAQRLAALLEDSRKYQNEVSERLAEQVMHALYELVRGLQAAHDASGGGLLREPLAEGGDRDDIYRGLLAIILRLVFLLYAEERGMLPEDDTFLRHYSLSGLYERLREDAALHPDTMDQRFGAWAQLLVLFRLIHDGARAHRTGGAITLPERHGAIFDPDRFPFLEGRYADAGVRQIVERVRPPLVSDGSVYRVLEKLLVLDGERISYRTLDVEQIGSVYETIMGFRMEIATGRSVAIKPAKKLGAPSTVDLDELLAQPEGSRARWLQAHAERNVTDTVAKALRAADTLEDLHAALDRVLDKDATPDLVPPGALVLQPNDERRRSGSHYTPRELTEPIVRHTLAPVLARLQGEDSRAPTPAQILDLKVCDPAMGSGAFLVETCRQLADALIEAWGAHGEMPVIPPDEDEVIHARRLVAQRCLYGIDRNPMAVDLSKMSLWLSTLARDHPLTFVDHAFRHGDSLVGLTRRQIEAFHWLPDTKPFQAGFEVMRVREHVTRAAEYRRRIREAGEEVSDRELHALWHDARNEIDEVRLYGDLALAAFFAEAKPKPREAKRLQFTTAVVEDEAIRYRPWLEEQRHDNPPLAPFHWEIEFPEVFNRENPGFDAFVGNPPFAGKNATAAGNIAGYPDWLKTAHGESHGNADLVAHFYRRAFNLIRNGGTLGLIATNTIAQGDTRSSGLRWICEHGGEIFRATKRVKWPGEAAVVVSVLHITKGGYADSKVLDGTTVDTITAFLFHRGGHDDPVRLQANAGKSFVGSYVLGMGFTFDDTDKKGVASPLAEMHRLIEANPHNREAIFPYIGGEEVNTSPTHAHHRYVINFRNYPLRREPSPNSWFDMDKREHEESLRTGRVPDDYPNPVAADWPGLLTIVEQRVKPERSKLTRNPIGRKRAEFWWHYGAAAMELYAAVAGLERVLVISRYGQNAAFTFLPAGAVYSDSIIACPFDTYAAFCALQSRPHEIWARFLGSSMKDDLRYTPSDCFETFPFPECTPTAERRPGNGPADGTDDIGLAPSGDWSAKATGQPDGWASNPNLETVGQAYYEYRAALMVRNDEGLTKTYNRFHDPYEDDPEIGGLRALHAAMDRAVLDAFGWTDISTDCEFLLDYEIDEATWGRKKKPYRYRWPDPVRDEVLTRLLALNAERAAEEARAGKATNATNKKPAPELARSRDRDAATTRPAHLVAEPKPLREHKTTPHPFNAPLTTRTRPKPSIVYPFLWRFAAERHRIYLQRVAGDAPPWTTDPVLSEYRFTNAFRASDRVSQYFIQLTYSDPHADDDTLLLRTLLFKVFNKVDTWKAIVNSLGTPVASEFSYSSCENVLDDLRRNGRSLYSAAYIMPSGGRTGTPKHRMHLQLIRRMVEDRLSARLQETKSLGDAYKLLLSYPTLGPFLAFQYAIDLNYTTLMNHPEQSFVVAGPGALDGLSKCFESLGDYSPEDTIRWLSEIQQEEFSRHDLDFDGLWDRPLQPIDVQNLFCEVSKYTRVTHPEFRGLSGRTRIKQRFKTAGTLPRPFFPPKWGINDRVDEWFVEQGANGSRGPESFDLASPPSTWAPDNKESD